MNRQPAWVWKRPFAGILVLAAIAVTSSPAARAQDDAATIAGPVVTVLDQLAADPLTPPSYTAAVTMRVKLRMFPFIGMTLKGSSTYERPGIYKFAFHGFPLVARRFEKMDFNLGDPKGWPETYDIALLPQSPGGSAVLRLTPRSSHVVAAVGQNEMVSQAQVRVEIGAIKADLNVDFANFVIRDRAVASD